jgi:uncharacterized protein
VRIVHAGEELDLSPLRAVHRPTRRQLLVADVHFGKAEAFRARGVPVPHGTTAENLARLETLISAYSPQEIVFLGDFLHALASRRDRTLQPLLAWRGRHSRLDIVLVRGNHDRHAGDPPSRLGIRIVTAPYPDPPFVLCHEPAECAGGFGIAGHLHPCWVLRGRAHQSARLPCFWLTNGCLVLPAFGSFTGSMEIKATPRDRLFVIAEDQVYALPGDALPLSQGR